MISEKLTVNYWKTRHKNDFFTKENWFIFDFNMYTPDPVHPSFRRLSHYSTDISVKILQSHPEVAKNMISHGFVYIPSFKKIFEMVSGVELIEPLLDIIKADKRLETNDKGFIRASYGHREYVLYTLLSRTHTQYTGPRTVFAFTHTSMDGLGVLNSGRNMNLLVAPEFVLNKGVKAYVDIRTLSENGIQVWKQNGDTHCARVHCFSEDIRKYVFKYEYSEEYLKPENLKKTHWKLMETFGAMYANLSKEEFDEKTTEKLKSLIVTEDSDDDADYYDDAFPDAMRSLSVC